MAEVIGTVSGILGIIVPALHSARLLRDDFNSIKDADEAIKPIQSDLNSLVEILSSLQATAQENTELGKSEHLKTAALNCTVICTVQQGKLSKWMKHSTVGKMSWRDRFRIGFLGEKEILEFGKQLAACKGTLTISLQMVTFAEATSTSSVQSQRIEAIIQKLETMEQAINQAVTLTKDRISDLDTQLQSMTITNQDVPDKGADNALPETAQRELLTTFESTCTQAKSEIASYRIKIGNVTQGNDSRALVGAFGFDGEEKMMNLDIGDVKLGGKSTAAIGTARGLDLNAFFKR